MLVAMMGEGKSGQRPHYRRGGDVLMSNRRSVTIGYYYPCETGNDILSLLHMYVKLSDVWKKSAYYL